jgi:hypothetical protein
LLFAGDSSEDRQAQHVLEQLMRSQWRFEWEARGDCGER